VAVNQIIGASPTVLAAHDIDLIVKRGELG